MENPATAELPPIVYRPNVAAILQRPFTGEIFIAERLHVRHAWQFPQGGVDDGEDLQEALVREIEEEIGVGADKIHIRATRGGYRYAFPKGRLKYGIYGGQEQTYYLCEFLGDDKDIRLDAHDQEFGRWKWIPAADFKLKWVPKFKRGVYHQVFKDFFAIDLIDND
jgi:putative (di)nucleoside polyphosphate hydrolase